MAILVPVVILALGAFLLYHFVIYPAYLSPLAQIPNAHPTAGWSSAWVNYIRFRHLENRTLCALHKKIGPVLRLAPNEVSVNTIDGGLRTIYHGTFDKHVWVENALMMSFGYVVEHPSPERPYENPRFLLKS